MIATSQQKPIIFSALAYEPAKKPKMPQNFSHKAIF